MREHTSAKLYLVEAPSLTDERKKEKKEITHVSNIMRVNDVRVNTLVFKAHLRSEKRKIGYEGKTAV